MILYTFRRCPYAIRARMTLKYAMIRYTAVQVDLKNKPKSLLNISHKGTVPVLDLGVGKILEESLDIMLWALAQNDTDNWLFNKEKSLACIEENDGMFKKNLDRYKYPNRYKLTPQDNLKAKNACQDFLEKLNQALGENNYLISEKIALADVALFPFVRQCKFVDVAWFESLKLERLNRWLEYWLNSRLFNQVMAVES